jgi:hypothetical protein
MNFKGYLNELKLVIKEYYILIIGFIVLSIVLRFISIPFLSIMLMLILVFYISKTEQYKNGRLLGKIFQFILFFIFLCVFVLVFSVPSVLFLLGHENVSTIEEIINSPLTKNFITAGAYISMIFIFAPYRIVDANVNVFKAIAYSCSVIINNFVLFLLIVVFVVLLDLLAIKIRNSDYYIFLLQIILTVALYKLNVKQSLIKGDKK